MIEPLFLADGGFPQVSGLKFKFDTTVASSVVLDSNGMFLKVAGERRVKDVRVLKNGEYEPLDLSARYKVGSSDYILLFGGDGIRFISRDIQPMPEGLPSVMTDLDLVEHYIINHLDGVIPSRYSHPDGRMEY